MSRRTVGGSGALARTRAAHARPRVRRKEFFFTKSRVAVHRAVVAGRRVAVVIIARRARARERCRAIRFTNASRRAVFGLSRGRRTVADGSNDASCARVALVRARVAVCARRASSRRRRAGGCCLRLYTDLIHNHRPIVVRARHAATR
jgi:hypothetical protein